MTVPVRWAARSPMPRAACRRRVPRRPEPLEGGPGPEPVQTRVWGGAVLTNGVQGLPANITRASLSPAGVLTLGAGNANLLDNNKVDPVGYLDLRLGYHWTNNLEIYGAVDNATNVPKPDDG